MAEKKYKIGYTTGVFDLLHIGHLNILRRAKEQCEFLIVGVTTDELCLQRKGKRPVVCEHDRMELVSAIRYVDRVVEACREDSDAWLKWHYDRLFVGSDYKGTERFQRYEEFFRDKGVEIIYFPYTQTTNSTQIRRTIEMKTQDDEAKK